MYENKKNSIIMLVIILFSIASMLYISPSKQRQGETKGYRSSELKKIMIMDEKTEKIEYVDSEGKITVAADLGYAIRITTKIKDDQIIEYFDDKGEHICRSLGYCIMKKEYDEDGNNIRIIYMDKNKKPCRIKEGYAIEEREFNENNKITRVWYYDTKGVPVCTSLYGFGKRIEYSNDGNDTKTTYIDVDGEPMTTTLGYATIVQTFYTTGTDKGKIKNEFYFDERGEPISLSLGQSGLHREYIQNNSGVVDTYLDAAGKPIVTYKGYTKVTRFFQADNHIASELYYDLDGKPISLSEGQYGIKQVEGRTIYLNQNGEEQFNLKLLLYNHSWIVIPLTIIIICLSTMVNKKKNIIIWALLILAIVYMTIMFREKKEIKNVGIFWYYKMIFVSSEARADIIKNIWLFIPLGAVLYQLYPQKIVLFFPLLISIIIEGIQYVLGIGFCELDDVISNGIGGWIGFAAGKMATDIKFSIVSWRQLRSVKEG